MKTKILEWKWTKPAAVVLLLLEVGGMAAAQQSGGMPMDKGSGGMDHSTMDQGAGGGMGMGGMDHGAMGHGGMSMGPDAEGMDHGGGVMMGHMMCRIGEHVEGKLAYLKAELKLTDAQTPRWNAFADALRTSGQKVAQYCASMKEQSGKAMPSGIIQQLGLMEHSMAVHLEAVRTIKAAAEPLFGVLTEEQKKTADQAMTGVMELGMIGGGVGADNSFAQGTIEASMENKDVNDHMGGHAGGSSDGAFHHRFDDASKWVKEFDNPERDAWQKPEEILDALHLDRAARVADIGAGTGYFSVRISRRIPEGKIFAADVEPDMVRYLGERAQREHLKNLTPVQASADSANLPEPVDVILVVDTYHHIGYRPQYFAKLKSSLRPKGRLAIVDFKADSPNGPPTQHRISPEKVTEELNTAGYSLVETHQFLPRQYFLVFEKRDQ